MAIVHLTEENFDAVTGEGQEPGGLLGHMVRPLPYAGPQSWSSWNGELGGSVKVCKVDIDEQPELARRFGVMSIPTLVAIKDGEVSNMRVGVQSLENLMQMVK